MALPLVRIVSALAPVVMGAFDLYRRRREAKEDGGSRSPGFALSPEEIRKRLEELEGADVEQARLISELSNTVEALATTLEREIDESKKRETRLRLMLWCTGVCSLASLGLVIWMLAKH